MKKDVFVLTGDYWHLTPSIEPLIDLLFRDELWNVTFTQDPKQFTDCENTPDLFVTFKDPIENDQIPTPVWCDDMFTDILLERIKNGMGFICCHAALTDMPENHRIITELTQSLFISHPEQCKVSFVPCASHEILKDIKEFEFPLVDEHYVMQMIPGANAEILAYMESVHGRQPALWINEYGSGRVCMLTPGHFTENLTCSEYLKLMKNAVRWCMK